MRLKKKNKNEKLTYGIVGLGRFGYALAMELATNGADLLVIDLDEDKVKALREFTENAFVMTRLDKKSLEETGIQNCDVAVVCIGEHMDSSILTTLHLVGMGIPHVIAKANSAEHGEILEKLGAEVVYPERDMALRLASRLEIDSMLDLIQFSERLNISKLSLPRQFVGKTVLEVDLRGRFGLNIIALENKGNDVQTITPDYIFRENDILFLSGSKDGLLKLSEWIM